MMTVLLIATHDCVHRQNLEHELRDLGIAYELHFVEEAPDLVARYNIRHSPNLVVDDEVVFRDQPTEDELRAFFAQYP